MPKFSITIQDSQTYDFEIEGVDQQDALDRAYQKFRETPDPKAAFGGVHLTAHKVTWMESVPAAPGEESQYVDIDELEHPIDEDAEGCAVPPSSSPAL